MGKEAREWGEDGTQLTWPITANEVRYKQRRVVVEGGWVVVVGVMSS